MKITVGDAHDLQSALLHLDDASLDPSAYLKVAININLLKPIVQGYETGAKRALATAQGVRRPDGAFDKSAAQVDAEFSEANARLRETEVELDLRTLLKPELRLADNGNKMNGSVIAKLWPILGEME